MNDNDIIVYEVPANSLDRMKFEGILNRQHINYYTTSINRHDMTASSIEIIAFVVDKKDSELVMRIRNNLHKPKTIKSSKINWSITLLIIFFLLAMTNNFYCHRKPSILKKSTSTSSGQPIQPPPKSADNEK